MNQITEMNAGSRVKSQDEELLDLIATQARRLPFAVFTVLALIAVLIYPHSEAYGWAIWLGAVLLVLAVRFFALKPIAEATNWSLNSRVNMAAALSALNGLVHASCLYYFPLLTDVERAIQSMILAGLGTAAIATTAGHRKVYTAYFLPIFPPLVFLWITTGTPGIADSTALGLALAIVVFATVLLLLARDTSRQFNESIRIRKEQEELNEQLQRALQDAAVADRAKTRFLAAASHDLRQPIHALSLFSAALKMQQLPENVEELVLNIDESITVLASQLDSLLDISRLDAGVVKPEIEVIDLSAMMNRIGREYEQQVADKGLVLSLKIDAECHVISDKLLLERIVRNLLNNAIRYSEEGTVSLSTGVEGDLCKLIVSDTGIGIPESEQANIFGEFYQVSQEYGSSKQGLGLGLSIVRRLSQLLELPLTLSSKVGEGTSIELALKLEKNRKETVTEGESGRLQDITVLVIDDDIAVRAAMTALLESHGANTCTAANIAESIVHAESMSALDVIVSDLRLGAENGVDAISSVRELVGDVPAILISGDTSTEQIHRAREANLDLMHKPVNATELEKKIADVVHAKQ